MVDLTGQKHGNLTVVKYVGGGRWQCRCACGQVKNILASTLLRHAALRCSRSCTAAPPVLTEPEAREKARAALANAVNRCTKPHNQVYAEYGGRGIRVCDQWTGTNGLEAFITDVGLPHTADVTLDRVDVNGDYAPGNCRLVTQKEQMRNTRKTHMLTVNGKTQSIAAWAEEMDIDVQLIVTRLRRGWSAARAVGTGVQQRNVHTRTLDSWRAMVSRCTNPRNSSYANYGGRGVKVCSQWLGANGFNQFLADMGQRPKGMTLDRIDVNGDYCPANCRWATAVTQANNRQNTTVITFRDVVHGRGEWARLTGLTMNQLRGRQKAGYPVARVLYPDTLRGLSPMMLKLVDTGAPVAVKIGVATADDKQTMTELTALMTPSATMMKRGLDLTGKMFGKLTVMRRVANHGTRTAWLCRCTCGKEVEVLTCNLMSGNSTSCGCQRRPKHVVKRDKRTYASWLAMISRCTCTGNADYARYGGRGIKVCDRWTGKDGYAHFLADMGKRPAKMNLDRTDVNSDYTPSNCRWATVKEQAVNRSSTVFIAFAGLVLTERQWAKLLGLDENAVNTRLRRGLPVAVALSTDIKTTRNVPLDKVVTMTEHAVADAVAKYGEPRQMSSGVDMVAAEHPQAFIAWRAAVKHQPGGLGFHEFLRVVGPMPVNAQLVVDDDGPLTATNCRWTTAGKRGKLRRIAFAGQELTLTKWSEIVGIKKSTLHVRLKTMDTVYALRPGNVPAEATADEVAQAVYARLTAAGYTVVKEDLSSVSAPVVVHGGRRKLDLTGQVFGKLTVLKPGEPQRTPTGAYRQTMHCRCICGNEVDVLTSNLRRGNTRSCGMCMKNLDSTNTYCGKLNAPVE